MDLPCGVKYPKYKGVLGQTPNSRDGKILLEVGSIVNCCSSESETQHAIEVLLAVWIRDNLTLNLVMLIHPIRAIGLWQLGH